MSTPNALRPLPGAYVPSDSENPHDYYTADQMREYARAAIAAASAVSLPLGHIDRKDIARLSNYQATIWPGTNEIDAVAVYLAAPQSPSAAMQPPGANWSVKVTDWNPPRVQLTIGDQSFCLDVEYDQAEPGRQQWYAEQLTNAISNIRMTAYQPPSAAMTPLTCIWTEQDDDDMPGTYASACGEMWSFNDGGVVENNVRFCQGCGKPVEVTKAAP